ncbi:hypothetical protein ACQ4PT_058723 [Festuca glaucescens]
MSPSRKRIRKFLANIHLLESCAGVTYCARTVARSDSSIVLRPGAGGHGGLAATGSWANLSRDMLSFIANAAGDGLSLGDYMRLRGVCTAWRSALAPPFHSLLGLADSGRRAPVRATVFFLPLRRSFRYLYMGSYAALDDSLYDNRQARPQIR